MLRYRFYMLLCIIVACILQHIIHELSHAIAAYAYKIKVKKIQWLTYYGGTKVWLEEEPDYKSEAPVAKKWAVIAAAGFISTNIIAYLSVILYHLLPSPQFTYVRVFFYFMGILFLFSDSAYFLLGSMGNFGDIVGIRKTLGFSKTMSIILSGIVFALNMIMVFNMW